MPDAAPAQRVLLSEPSAPASTPAETKRPARRSKPAPPPEHASDEGLFTGSLQAVERASLFLRGEPREDPTDDAGDADTEGLDSPIRD
jgi:hypothetical protein